MTAQEETRAIIAGLVNLPPYEAGLMSMARTDDFGAELALVHIELMREAGEVIPPSLLALEQYLVTHRPAL